MGPRKAKQEVKLKNVLQHCVHQYWVQASPTCCPPKKHRAKAHRALGNCDRMHEQTDFSTFSAKMLKKGDIHQKRAVRGMWPLIS